MSDIEDTQEVSHCSRCSFEQLEALHQLNIEAKRYAESAEDAYTAGLKANARLYSLRKKALSVLPERRFVNCAESWTNRVNAGVVTE